MIRQEVGGISPAPVMSVSGNHVEMVCTFTSGGTAVNVVEPTFSIVEGVTGSTVSIPAASLLVPFCKDGAGTGKYHTCFLGGSWIADGDYTITMSGKYPTASGGTIALSGSFTVREAPTIQTFIELLRGRLFDRDGSLYYIENRETFMWSDGDLYESLIASLDQINITPPSRYLFSLDGRDDSGNPACPWQGLLLDGGLIYALHRRGLLEIPNTINYNDEISFSIDRSGKYQSMLQVFYSVWQQSLLRTKRDYAFARAFPIGMGQQRMPFVISRIMSFHPNLQSVFGASNW